MKHVFVVHSHTSFLVALGTIELLRLRQEDVIMLLGRNYKNDVIKIPCVSIDISPLLLYSRDILFSIKKQKALIDSFDRIIEQKIGTDFYAYVPHLSSWGFQIIATSKYCKGINLCQESARSFFTTIKPIKRLVKSLFLCTTKRMWAQYNWYPPSWAYRVECGLRTFSFSDTYFAPIKNATHYIVSYPSIPLDFEIDTERPIFVFEAAIEQGNIEESIYIDECRVLIETYSQDKNYVKFHPGQTQEHKEIILKCFGKKHFDVLPDSIPFELIIMKYNGLYVYGFYSSLLSFAKEMGHIVTFKVDALLKRSSKYRKHISRMQ